MTIDQVGPELEVPVNEYDGKVVYGQKLKRKGGRNLQLLPLCGRTEVPCVINLGSSINYVVLLALSPISSELLYILLIFQDNFNI